MPWFWPFSHSEEINEFSSSSLVDGISDDALLLIFLVAGVIGLWIYYSG